MHSIETFITYKAKFDSMSQRLEALKTKDPASVNQVSPKQSTFAGCTYCQTMNHVFEECLVFLAHQTLSESMNAAFARPTNNPYSQTYNPGWRNHRNFSWAQNTNDYPRPNFSNNFQLPYYQHNFLNQAPQFSFQSPTANKISTDLEIFLTSFMQNTGQAISRLEG